MSNLNCWEFNKCGREPKGKNAHQLGICPAAVFEESDGFCDGKNGGRACMFIAGTYCLEIVPGTHRESLKNCGICDFYRMLKQEYGSGMSVFLFQRYVKEREKDLPGIPEHEICNIIPLPVKEDLVKADGLFQTNDLKDIWRHLLNLVDYCNHAVKHGEWYQEDIIKFYNLKDSVMEKFYRDPPPEATVTLKKVMKTSNDKFDYSPDWEQHSQNTNGHGRILIEMEITYRGRMFCLHIPIEKATNWGLNIMSLSSKEWVPSREFNRQFFKDVFEEIQQLISPTLIQK